MPANQRITRFQDSAENMYEAAGSRMTEACESAEEMVRHNPTTSLLVTFGVGVGLGLAMTALMMPSRRQTTWAERNLPDWITRERLASAMSSLSHLPEKVSSQARSSSWW
jgi:hypothetical protein